MIGRLASESSLPVIVAGDFNSSPPGFAKSETTESGNNAIEAFDEWQLFQRSPVENPAVSEMTFPSNAPAQVLDWILVPGEMEIVDYQVISMGLSDHLPVVADVVKRSAEERP